MNDANEILSVSGLHVHFPLRRGVLSRTVGWVKAVDGVDLSVPEGSTVGLVGESGCGKTTLARTVVRLIREREGRIAFQGEDLTQIPSARLRQLRRHLQLVFQDPFASLDPRFTVAQILQEGLRILEPKLSKDARDRRTAEMLTEVGLDPESMTRYPHEFSGGQRQRISIARALIMRPKMIILDEPVSSLDVSVQAQVLNLLRDLQRRFGLTYLFIAHDLDVIRHMSDEVYVMRAGRIIEQASTEKLFGKPSQEYTRRLLDASPRIDAGERGTHRR
ncbi:MAG: ATP-binding cassette domain-containing protein [Candidatus Omnitrophica bacterium]|nr:ATP-binding cassette domain-containing protein [Candidatus Omnitrophota bacterium]